MKTLNNYLPQDVSTIISDYIYKFQNTMNILNTYLPKDVSNVILDYLYKPDIKKLNNEYSSKYQYSEVVRLLWSSYETYNYRDSSEYNQKINHELEPVDDLPFHYWYSSGCNRLDGYINK